MLAPAATESSIDGTGISAQPKSLTRPHPAASTRATWVKLDYLSAAPANKNSILAVGLNKALAVCVENVYLHGKPV